MIIFTTSPYDYFKDIFEENTGKEYYGTKKWGYLEKLIRIITNKKVVKYVPDFIKYFLFKQNLPKRAFVNKEIPITFVFIQGGIFGFNRDYIKFLKNTFVNSTVVMYLTNPVSTLKQTNLGILLNSYDCIYSYDYDDCKKYGWNYYPLFYKKINKNTQKMYKKSDVFFCGRAKDRLNSIYLAYKTLSSVGFNCLFFLVDVKESEQLKEKGLIYVNHLSYKDYIGYLENAKCLLEIVQKVSNGYTLRCCEAIVYDKLLITNNKNVQFAQFYDDRFITIVKDDNYLEINKSILDKEVRYTNKKHCSPELFLEQLN